MTYLVTPLAYALLMLGLSACSAPQALPRRSVAPATAALPASLERARELVEAAERRAPADRAGGRGASPAPSAARPAAPIHRTFMERVEVPTERRVAPGRDAYVDYLERARSGRTRGPIRFPINAAVGAGVGAVIGHQSGRRDEGALWGASVGLLFDFARWSR